MEDDLDRIAAGDEQRTDVAAAASTSATAAASEPACKTLVTEDLGEHRRARGQLDPDRRTDASSCASAATARTSSAATTRATVPDDLAPDELTAEKAEELLSRPAEDRSLGTAPGDRPRARRPRGPLRAVRHRGRCPRGRRRSRAPRRSSSRCRSTRSRSTRRSSCSRCRASLGAPTTARRSAQNGRYGPYIQKGKESRSLESEEQLFTIDADQALALLAQPKQRGRGAAAAPLKELGADPVSGKPIVVKDGRFGPYVTDGETNASLRQRRRGRDDHDRSRRRAARRPARARPGETGPQGASAPLLTHATARPSKLVGAATGRAGERTHGKPILRPERNTRRAQSRCQLVTEPSTVHPGTQQERPRMVRKFVARPRRRIERTDTAL